MVYDEEVIHQQPTNPAFTDFLAFHIGTVPHIINRLYSADTKKTGHGLTD